MGLGEKVNGLWNGLRKVVVGGGFYAGVSLLALTNCSESSGGSGSKPPPSEPKKVASGPYVTDEQGETVAEDSDGDPVGIVVKDEKTLNLLPDKTVYVIHHSEEVYTFDSLKNHIADFRIEANPIDLEILLSSLADRINDGLDEYKTQFHAGQINWTLGTTKIASDIPLSQLADFYETNGSQSFASVLEVASNYWQISCFAKCLWESRDFILENSSNVASLLGLNPDDVLYDIYRENTTGLLYHERVDNIPVSNIKPIVKIDFVEDVQVGDTDISYILSDANNDTCSITVEYSTDGINFSPATNLGWYGGVTDLFAIPAGTPHLFSWDSHIDDVGKPEEKVWIRITPHDGFANGLEDIITLNVDNARGIWKSSDINADDSTPGVQDLNPMPNGRISLMSAVVDDNIYVIGGSSSMIIVGNVEMYDPIADNWTVKSGLINVLSGTSASVVNGKIYVFGDYEKTQEYDPPTDTWIEKSEMPTLGRSYFTSAVVNDKIYVIGGFDDSIFEACDIIEEYNPLTDTWKSSDINANDSTPGVQDLNPMPTEREELTCAVVNDKIYVFAGIDNEGWGVQTVEMYDPSIDTWVSKDDMPFGIGGGGLSSSVVSGKIFVFGYRRTFMYDPVTDAWTKKNDVPYNRVQATSSSVNGKIYLVGGGADEDIIEEYTP